MRKMFTFSIAIFSLILAGSVTVFAQGIPDKSQAAPDQTQGDGPHGNFTPGSIPEVTSAITAPTRSSRPRC